MTVPPAAPHSTDIGLPSQWVMRFAALVPAGEVLDLACGSGRHARLFASLGHQVLAADRDPAALAQVQAAAADAGLPEAAIVTRQVDFETTAFGGDGSIDLRNRLQPQSLANSPVTTLTNVPTNLSADAPSTRACHWPFGALRFAAIVVTNYLHRPLLPYLAYSLAPGGVLIYETFAVGNGAFGKPSNPAFLLQPGELLHFALGCTPPLRIVAFEDGHVVQPMPAMVQRLCAVRPAESSGSVHEATPFAPQNLRL